MTATHLVMKALNANDFEQETKRGHRVVNAYISAVKVKEENVNIEEIEAQYEKEIHESL